MQIADDCAVFIHYTLTNDDGEVLDSSDGGDPLGYLHGHSNIVTGLESALTAKKVGDVFDVSVPPADGYGEFNEEMVQAVPRDMFENAPELEPGMMFQARTPQGTQVFTVVEVDEKEVKIDGNHALAGQTLNFHVEVSDVRAATDEEKAHGHLHMGDHGCCDQEGGGDKGGCCGGGSCG